MADNVTTQSATLATVPANEVFAFDECSINSVTVKVCRNKIGYGADGSYTEVSSANPLPTTDASALTSLQLLDDAVATTGSAITTKGLAAAGTDGTNARVLKTDASGELQIDVLTLPAITNAGTFAVQVDGTALTALQLIDNLVLAEDAPHASADPGVQLLAVRKAAPVNLSGIDGDYEPLQVSAGRLWVDPSGVTLTVASHAVTNAGTFTVQVDGAALTALQLLDDAVYAEDAAHTTGEKGLFVLGVRRDANTTFASTDGDYTPFSIDANGNLKVNVVAGGAGDGAILDGVSASIKATVFDYTNSNPLAVRLTDTSGDYVGAGAGTQYTEDAAAAADPVGTALMMVRDDVLSGQTTADGDNVAARGTDKGELYVKHVDVIPVSDNGGLLSVDDGGASVSIDDNSGSITTDTAGTTAHDAVGTGVSPLLVGGYASAAAPTDVSADGDAVRAWHLRNGATATVITAAGALVGGDATNGLDVDVTRLPALVAGTANIGDVDVLTQPGAANIANGQVSVTTTAANIVAARATRRAVTIVNHGTTDVYIGVATVTTANGLLLKGTAGAALTLFTTAAVQGIVASGTQTISYLEEYE